MVDQRDSKSREDPIDKYVVSREDEAGFLQCWTLAEVQQLQLISLVNMLT